MTPGQPGGVLPEDFHSHCSIINYGDEILRRRVHVLVRRRRTVARVGHHEPESVDVVDA